MVMTGCANSCEEKLKKLLDETRPLQLAFVKDKAKWGHVQHEGSGTMPLLITVRKSVVVYVLFLYLNYPKLKPNR